MKKFLLAGVLLIVLVSVGPAAALVGQPQLPSLAPMLSQVTPSVVNIAVRGRVRVNNPLLADPFFRQFFNLPDRPLDRQTEASGSGVIVDAAHGYVLTNAHVIENAELIEITTKDNRRLSARLVGQDSETDIAVLKVEARDLVAIPFGDSDKLEVGDYVVAIGNPFGLGQTVTQGIVSALGRSGLGIEGYEEFIQTDASINPGNSGGALVSYDGKLIGINTAILAPNGGNVGVGFAVPINMAREVMNQLVVHGVVKRGLIGVGIQDLTPELAHSLSLQRAEGAVITQVQPGLPAEQAGVRAGDVVTAVNAIPVRSAAQLRNRIGLARVGETLTLTIDRKGQALTVRAPVSEGPRRPVEQRRERRSPS